MSRIVERTLDCFELFADQKQPLSLSEISRLLGIPPSSCHDVLQSLRRRGYLYELSPRGGFYPTLRLYDVARAIADNDPVQQRAEMLLKSLRDALDESVQLSKVSGLQATYLLALESSQPLRMIIKVGNPVRSLHATSAGKALLASLDERALAAYLRTAQLDKLTPHTVSSKSALREQLKQGRKLGYFVNREESVEGVTTLSCPFKWQDTLYLVTVAGPTWRVEPRISWAAQLLMDVCRRLEATGEPAKA
jgi:DNA-binding IclR family transcriptional regulator